MRRIISLIIFVSLMFTLISCVHQKSDVGKIRIVTTIFPVYDWVREIVGGKENVEITMLLNSETDLHSFQPAADDIIKIAGCDMFVYVGGESDKWADDALKENYNRNRVVINLLDILGDSIKTEELKEGMQAVTDEDDHECVEYDEHVWLSVKNAIILCNRISDSICEVDAENAETYKANTNTYIEKLRNLDKNYAEAVENAGNKTLIFGDRFPFRYLTDDYGIDYFAAFVGCSAESEASFKTIIFLANKLDELGLNSIIKTEGSNGTLANTINNSTQKKNAKILTLNSMQSITASEISKGSTYIGICEENLKVLKEALE